MRTERQDANQLKNRLVLPCRFPASFRYIPVSFIDDDTTSAVLSRLFVLYTKATEQLKNQPPPRDRESPRWHGGGRPRR